MLEFYKQIEEQALRMANSAEHHNHRRFLSSFSDIYRISKRWASGLEGGRDSVSAVAIGEVIEMDGRGVVRVLYLNE